MVLMAIFSGNDEIARQGLLDLVLKHRPEVANLVVYVECD